MSASDADFRLADEAAVSALFQGHALVALQAQVAAFADFLTVLRLMVAMEHMT